MDFLSPAGPLQDKGTPSPESDDSSYVLVADDNEGDRLLLKKALEENQIHRKFHFVTGGLELITLLEQCKATAFKPATLLPCLILLDLYMPRLDGHETLRIVKNDRSFKKIPVIILTASHNLDDVVQSYHDGANSFLTKPMEFNRLVELVGLVKQYWLEESQLPV